MCESFEFLKRNVIYVEGHLHHPDEMIAAIMWILFSGRIYKYIFYRQ
jgi:hypothetical protein